MQARRVAGLFALALIASLAFVSGTALAVEPVADDTVVTANVYVHSSEENPWESDDPTANQDAMTSVFGPDDWEEEHFETVDTGTGSGGLFAPSVRFIFLDGSDGGTDELDAFLAANEGALQAFVSRGGRLLLNAAPNSGDGLLEYDGRQIVDTSDNPDFVVAADGSHQIFNGPFTPAGTAFEGDSFAHATVTGPGLTALILGTVNDEEGAAGDPGVVVLAEYASGSGRVLIGGMTIPFFHEPQPNGDNLRANIIAYAAGRDVTPPTSSSSGCVSTTEVGITVTDRAGGSGPASVRYTLDGGAEQTVATDASGNARIAVASGEHVVAFRGVDNAGNVEGSTNSVTVTCSAAETAQDDDTRPRVAVRGLPSGCVRDDFRIRVIARDGGSGVDRVVVRRDGRRLVRRSFAGTSRASFTVRVPAVNLRSGRHRIRVGVRDEDGNVRRLRRSFRRCARPAQPAPVSPVLTG